MIEIENQSEALGSALKEAYQMAEDNRHEYLTPEHLLLAIAHQQQFKSVLHNSQLLEDSLKQYIHKYVGGVPSHVDYEGPEPSFQLEIVAKYAYDQVMNSKAKEIDIPHIIHSIMYFCDSFAHDVLEEMNHDNKASFLSNIIMAYSNDEDDNKDIIADKYIHDSETEVEGDATNTQQWLDYVVCINDLVDKHNKLIGRDDEIEHTIRVLCRKDKNNPLHVGEPGVGKTAIVYGLAERINRGEVPERLQGSKIFSLDVAALMAGTQYRGDFEKRLKNVLKGLGDQRNAILYIDEIHTLIGAGRVEGGTIDAANLLKPYLEQGTIRFMGATTYEEYNREFVKNKGFARRFEKIDIVEPSLEQCREIITGLKEGYETYHNVVYTDEAIDYAVTASDKYITGRFLPDKAIDLIDDAGAWCEVRGEKDKQSRVVEKSHVAEVLARICHVDTLAEDKTDVERLETLNQRILAEIYGQDKAVNEVSEAVLMASAGLLDDNKPMASLLFVGPTGVGKTEVAKVLARELNVPLIRFDMSEYAEKHTVAKLIGSPAGYVGYDDGGLLTDAIRKTPHCVLLFDELEKAHSDIYNILLQVMDYAVLTDNKGQKADFRHVIFIMTTNAGAQYARQGIVGFTHSRSAGDVMLKSVKSTFKPEFLNRLTGITIFNDMNRNMAMLILNKKLRSLKEKLSTKNVELQLTDEAMDYLLSQGFSEEYGGREIDRVLTTQLKPLLMRAILFGTLKNGGYATIGLTDTQLNLL